MRTRTRPIGAIVISARALLGWLVVSEGSSPFVFAQNEKVEKSPTGGSPVLPVPDAPFGGVIGRKADESKPDFPQDVAAPAGAPNVLLIMTDDTGFGASSTFGGPISTPNFDRVAKSGLKYNCFHTTALCSPTRAALLTGRNHHTCGMANITEFATGYPGYTSLIPKSVGTVGNILVNNGYNMAWFGKHHLVPEWMQGPGGPYDQWAAGLGFDCFYGFLGGDSDQWHPALFENNVPVVPPFGDPNYILITDLADRSINWIRTQHAAAPDKPFFLYFAPGNSHAPHHAPKDWIAKFKGQFDQGWDRVREETLARQKSLGVVPDNTVLTPRSEGIPAWDSLSDEQQKVFARMMEVYAATVAQSDHEIGRILDALETSGQLDNTLVIYLEGDNGASAEGTMQGTTSEVSAQFAPESIEYLASMIDELGSDKTYNHYALLVLDGKPVFVYACTNQDGEEYPQQRKDKTRFVGPDKLAAGKHTLAFDFVYDGGGLGKRGKETFSVDGATVAESRIEQTNPHGKFTLDESFDVGLDTGFPVIDDYDAKMPFKFTGTLKKVEIKLGADKLTQQEKKRTRTAATRARRRCPVKLQFLGKIKQVTVDLDPR